MVVYVEDLVVKQKKWLEEKIFKEGVAIAQAIPGATVMQLVAYVGFKLRGLPGALVTFTAFGLPAFIFLLCLSVLYEKTSHLPHFNSLFVGLRVVVVAIVSRAFLNFFIPISRKLREVFIAFFSFVLFYAGINPFWIILGCAILSLFFFKEKKPPFIPHHQPVNWKLPLIFLAFISAFLTLLYLWDKLLFTLAFTMMKIDLFAFGGGYASLPLMLHEVVDKLHWMERTAFIDGIALGQITPGPIVITATFVGYFVKKFVGAVVATISMFTPSFSIMGTVVSFQEKIRHSEYFLRIKKGLLASFSGLLLFADLKFFQAIDWTLIKALLFLSAFGLLMKRVNIFYVVIGVVIISFFLF